MEQTTAPISERCNYPRECAACHRTFTAHGNRAKYCSLSCKNWSKRHPDDPLPAKMCKTCGAPTSGLKFEYCSTDCRPIAHQPGRTPTSPRSTRRRVATCAYCNDEFTTVRPLQRYCSEACSDRGSSTPGTYQERLDRRCEYCGAPLPATYRLKRRFCTESHQVMHNQAIRRARRNDLPNEHIDLATILDRDDDTCHICGTALAGDRHLDHIIPLALESSPGHVWENVAFTHAKCNIGKNARVTDHDWDLYQRLCELRNLGGARRWQTSTPETEPEQNDSASTGSSTPSSPGAPRETSPAV